MTGLCMLILCFNVGCFYLQYEIYAPSPHLGKRSKPSLLFLLLYFVPIVSLCVEHVAFLVLILHVCLTRGIPCPYPTCVYNSWYSLSLSYMCV